MNARLRSQFRRRGFTLIEVMISVALIGLLLVGLNFFVFSMGDLWGRSGDRRLVDQHVEAVTRYLKHEFKTAGLPPAVTIGTTAFYPADIRTPDSGTQTLLTFVLPAGSRLFAWPARPLPEVVCSLEVVQGKGLYFLWHSRLEQKFGEDPPRAALVSPFVSAMTYDYFDPDLSRWTTEQSFKKDPNGAYLTPQRIRLTFTYGKYSTVRVITLPQAVEGVPNY